MKINNYDTELDELLNCPFCGSKPTAHLTGNEYLSKMGKKISITIKCPKCNVQRTTGAIRNTIEWLEDTSIKLWNTRV